jgi:hypothetical protein
MTGVDYLGELAAAESLLRRSQPNGHGPVTTSLTLAPTFPIDVLPPPVRAYVADAAASLNAAAEMVAVPLLGFAGSTVGNRLHLILKNSYREYPTLYLAIIAPPGSAKTPALNLAQWPLDAQQTEAEQRYHEQKARFDEELETWRQAKDTDRGPKPVKPRLRDYFSSNLTLEALVDMLDRAPGVAIIRDEILGWVSSMDQYRGGKGSDRQEYLSLWSAKTIKLDRKGSDPIYRRFPVACVVGGIQPDLVGGLHDAAKKRDGFVERLLPVVPDTKPMPWTEETISAGRYTAVLAVFRRLDNLPLADVDGGGNAVGIGVALSPEARRIYVAWFNENQALIARTSGLATGFYSKLPAHVARLALILHALWNPEDPRVMVSAERMADAIELGEFFRAHIGRFLALLEASPPTRSAGTETRITRILRKPELQDVDGWVNRTVILDGLRTVSAAELSEVRDEMEAAGTIEVRTNPGVKKPIEQWRLRSPSPSFGASEYSGYIPTARTETDYTEKSETPNGRNVDVFDALSEEIVI